jgi:hypothetical protein
VTAGDEEETESLVGSLANADVRWDGTPVGLSPALSESARAVLDRGDAAFPALIDALRDESRFAVAHVLLTLMSGVRHGTVPWNGLDVDLNADGTARIDPAQRERLERRWRRWMESTPRPDELA